MIAEERWDAMQDKAERRECCGRHSSLGAMADHARKSTMHLVTHSGASYPASKPHTRSTIPTIKRSVATRPSSR